MKWLSCALFSIVALLLAAAGLYWIAPGASHNASVAESPDYLRARYEKLQAKYRYLKAKNESLHEKLKRQRKAFLAFERSYREALEKARALDGWLETEALPYLGLPPLVMRKVASQEGACRTFRRLAELEEAVLGYRESEPPPFCEKGAPERCAVLKERAFGALHAYLSLDGNDTKALPVFWKERINGVMETLAPFSDDEKRRMLAMYEALPHEANLSESVGDAVEEVVAYWRYFYGLTE
ncbi:hypothetical protein [Hydrogenimonas sp.]